MNASSENGLDLWLAENEPKAADLLKRIDDLAKTIRPKFDLQYGCGSGLQISSALNEAVKGNITATGLDASRIPIAEKLKAVFAQVYEMGSSSGVVAMFRWTRLSAVADALEVFKYSLKHGYMNAAYLQVRSVFELCGSVALLCKDIESEVLSEASPQEMSEWMVAVIGAANQRGGGTKVDWENVVKNGLIKGKSKSYKPSEDLQDKSAVDLMKGVDLVDKKIKGARHAYDYLSEYAHPNVGIVSTGVKSGEHRILSNGFELQYRTYSSSSIGSITVDGSLFLFVELLEILEGTLLLLVDLDTKLEPIQMKLSEIGKKVTRIALKNYRELFEAAYPCPCFSGKIVSACCGRAIRLGNRNH